MQDPSELRARAFRAAMAVLRNAEAAEEVAQEALIRWHQRDDVRDPGPWISVIARNLAYSEHRKRQVREAADPPAPAGPTDAEWAAELARFEARLPALRAALPAEQRRVLEEVWLAESSSEEWVAKELVRRGLPDSELGRVRDAMFKRRAAAILTLRRLLEAAEGDP